MDSDGHQRGMRSNIWKIYCLRMVGDYLFMIGVIVPFWQHWGLTLGNAFLLQSAYALTSMACNIPTGYLADKWGLKNTVVLGAALGIVGTGLYCVGTGFGAFVGAEMVLGLRTALYSGTFDAYTYETLIELGKTDDYRRIASNQRFVGMMVSAAGSIAGGLIAQWSLRATAWTTLAAIIAVFFLSLTLTEPKRHATLGDERESVWQVFRACLRDARIRSVLLLSSVLVALTRCLGWFIQPYQEQLHIPFSFFGISSALLMLASAQGSRIALPLSKRWQDRWILPAVAVTICISYILTGTTLSLWLLPFFFVTRFAAGVQDPIVSDILNQMPLKAARATVLSVQSFLAQLLFALAAPLLGYWADIFSLTQAIFLSGLCGALVTLILFLFFLPAWREMR